MNPDLSTRSMNFQSLEDTGFPQTHLYKSKYFITFPLPLVHSNCFQNLLIDYIVLLVTSARDKMKCKLRWMVYLRDPIYLREYWCLYIRVLKVLVMNAYFLNKTRVCLATRVLFRLVVGCGCIVQHTIDTIIVH